MSLAAALLDELAESDLALLAERLRPHLALVRDERQDDWLDSKEAARYLRVPLSSLHKLTASREIPFEQEGAGCKLYFKRSALDAWRRSGR